MDTLRARDLVAEVSEIDRLARCATGVHALLREAALRLELCREGGRHYPALWSAINDHFTTVSWVLRDAIGRLAEIEEDAPAELRFVACGFREATHYRHLREGAIFPIADLHQRHPGQCVLPLRLT